MDFLERIINRYDWTSAPDEQKPSGTIRFLSETEREQMEVSYLRAIADEHGYFVIEGEFNPVESLTVETFRAVINEASVAKLKPPYFVIGRYEIYQSPSVFFIKPDASALKGFRYLVLDCEIANPIESEYLRSRHKKIVHWAKSWTDYEGMGLACVCLWDFWAEEYHVFADLPGRSPLSELPDLLQDYQLIAFKGSFDMNLLLAHGILQKPVTYRDILAETRIAAGLPPLWSPGEKGNGRSYSLESLSLLNLGRTSGGSGKDCPFDWQYGKKGRVIAKCLLDVRNTSELALASKIIDPNDGRRIELARPNEMEVFSLE